MSAGNSEDPLSEWQTMTTGSRGIEGAVKAWTNGTAEVKDLLKFECDMIFECRYCRNLYRSIPTFLSHKRQFCKTLCRTVTPNSLISKHLEDFTSLFVNDKATPPASVKKGTTRSRHNIAAAFQKKIHTTTLSDDVNRVDLYSLPSVSRYQPLTTFEEGKQIIIRKNPLMAIKEHQPDDGALLIMPQDSNVSQKCGEMTLRRRKVADVEEKEMTGKELIVLDYIPVDIRRHINPVTCQCLYERCEEITKPFGSLLALAYHLTVTHNRQINAKDIARLRKGREGQLLCFLCGTTHGGPDKLKSHIQKEHSDIRDTHILQRRKLFDATNSKARRKLDATAHFNAQRHRSISPTLSEIGKDDDEEEEEDSAELPVTESMEIDEQSNDSYISSKSDLQSSSTAVKNGIDNIRKLPIAKKKKRPRLTMKRKNLKKLASSKVSKDISPTEEPPKLEPQDSASSQYQHLDDEMEEDDTQDDEEEEEEEQQHHHLEHEEGKSTTSESQNIPELTSQADSVSPRYTRSPSNDVEGGGGDKKGLAQTRSKRTRRPKQIFTFVAKDNSGKSSSKSRGSREPPKKKSRPPEAEFLTPKLEIDEDMPVLHSQEISSLKKPTPKKVAKIRASSSSKTTPSKLKMVLKSEFDTDEWITPDSSQAEEMETTAHETPKKKLPYTPKAAAAFSKETMGGSSRRKQKLNISDDHDGNTPKRLESEEKEERTKPTDLSLIPIVLTPADEELFFKPLKPLFKNGNDGNHQCSECGIITLSQKEGRRHMLAHVRAVRFRCALCDVGAFYCEDMRVHLMNRHCPSLHLVPDKYSSLSTPCMTTKEADELTQIVHQETPGQYRYTSGKIVTNENPKPHRPNPAIEESILGSIRPPYISPKKEQPRAKVPILSRSNKSPSRLVGTSSDGANASPHNKPSTQNETRIVSPLKLIRTNIAELASSPLASSSKIKLPGFKLLKPADSPPVHEAAESEAATEALPPSTSAAAEPIAPHPASPPPAAAVNIEQPEEQAPPQIPDPEHHHAAAAEESSHSEMVPVDPIPTLPPSSSL